MLFTSYNKRRYRYSPLNNSITQVERQNDDEIQHPFDHVVFPLDVELVRETTHTRTCSMVLCLTESCNMRCSYCVYSGCFPGMRSHSSRIMDDSTAFAAIDWLKSHSSESENVRLYFFGGEPLLQFDRIKRIVDYANAFFGSNKISFSISTNGSLLNENVVEWLQEHSNVSLCVTLNGPKSIHNRLRKYAGGTDTWEDIINGLRLIQNKLGDECLSHHVHFIANYANPVELGIIHRWYVQNGIKSVHFYPLTLAPEIVISKTLNVMSTVQERLYYRRILSEIVQESGKNNILPLYVTSKSSMTADLHFRYKENANSVVHNGFCIPFSTRVMVDVDGYLHFCERTDTSSKYGHVSSQDIDYKKLEYDFKQVGYLIDHVTKCRFCPAVRFCQMCYSCFLSKNACSGDENRQNTEQTILLTCQKMRETFRRELSLYSSLMETVPELLDTLEKPKELDSFVQQCKIEALKRIIAADTRKR